MPPETLQNTDPEKTGASFTGFTPAQGLFIEGIGGVAAGLANGPARRKESAAAAAALEASRAEFEGFQFTNPFANLENQFEDLTVNQQQAKFLAGQQQQGLAQAMGASQASFGGGGIAAATQALVAQQSNNLQQASASIGLQESANTMATAKGAAALQKQKGIYEERRQQSEFGRTSTILGMDQARSAAAIQAKAQATKDLVGGVGKMVIGGVGAFYGL